MSTYMGGFIGAQAKQIKDTIIKATSAAVSSIKKSGTSLQPGALSASPDLKLMADSLIDPGITDMSPALHKPFTFKPNILLIGGAAAFIAIMFLKKRT
jgi:hypothetical protein